MLRPAWSIAVRTSAIVVVLVVVVVLAPATPAEGGDPVSCSPLLRAESNATAAPPPPYFGGSAAPEQIRAAYAAVAPLDNEPWSVAQRIGADEAGDLGPPPASGSLDLNSAFAGFDTSRAVLRPVEAGQFVPASPIPSGEVTLWSDRGCGPGTTYKDGESAMFYIEATEPGLLELHYHTPAASERRASESIEAGTRYTYGPIGISGTAGGGKRLLRAIMPALHAQDYCGFTIDASASVLCTFADSFNGPCAEQYDYTMFASCSDAREFLFGTTPLRQFFGFTPIEDLHFYAFWNPYGYWSAECGRYVITSASRAEYLGSFSEGVDCSKCPSGSGVTGQLNLWTNKGQYYGCDGTYDEGDPITLYLRAGQSGIAYLNVFQPDGQIQTSAVGYLQAGITYSYETTVAEPPGRHVLRLFMPSANVLDYCSYIVADPTPPCTDDATSSDPSPVQASPGQQFNVTLSFDNTGTCTWRSSDGYHLISVLHPLGANDRIALPQDVPPGEQAQFSVSMTAPTSEGVYSTSWSIARDGEPFGAAATGTVNVVEPPPPEVDSGFRPNPNGYGFANARFARDWSMFRELYGAENVERSNGQPCAEAQKYFRDTYKWVANGWSCVGFSMSSLFSYLSTAQPNSGRYAIRRFPQLYQEQSSQELRDAIAYYSGTQLTKRYGDEYGAWLAGCKSSASYAIDTMWRALSSRDTMVVSMKAGSVWHAMVPYRALRLDDSHVRIDMYDSEAPGIERSVDFTRTNGEWRWTYEFTGSLRGSGKRTGGCTDMFAMTRTGLDPVEPLVRLCAGSNVSASHPSVAGEDSALQQSSGRVLVQVPWGQHWELADSYGRRMAWRDGEPLIEIPNGYYIPQSLAETDPQAELLYVPVGEYEALADGLPGTASIAAYSDGRYASLLLTPRSQINSPRVSFPEGLGSATLGGVAGIATFEAELASEAVAHSRVAAIAARGVVGDDDVKISLEARALSLQHEGGRLEYQAYLRQSGDDDQDYRSVFVMLGPNERHVIVPDDWNSLDRTAVYLEIDRGIDGSVDERRRLLREGEPPAVLLPRALK